MYPCLNYDDTYMKLAKFPKYNSHIQPDMKAEAVKKLQSYLIAFFLFLVHHLSIHWELSIKFLW